MHRVYHYLTSALLLLLPAFGASAAESHDKTARPVKLFPFLEGDKWGYIDAGGTVVIAPRFREADDFRSGRARVVDEGGVSYLDEQGKIAFAVREALEDFDWTLRFSEGMLGFSAGGKCGYLDREGKVAIEPLYDDVLSFSEGLAAVNVGARLIDEFPGPRREGGKWGFIDKRGGTVIDLRFESVEFHGFSNGLAQVHAGSGPFMYIDKSGAVVFKLAYKSNDPRRHIGSAHRFSAGLAAVYIDGKGGPSSGFVDKTGKFVIEPKFSGAGDFSEGLAPVYVGGKSGYIDSKGRFAIKPRYEGASGFSEGLAAVRIEKAWCFIDKQGHVVVPPARKRAQSGPFNDFEDFSGGLARVHVGGEYELTDDGPAARVDGTWYYVNRQGQVVRTCMHDPDDLSGPYYGRGAP